MELVDANFVLGICDRFHKLPSEVNDEYGELIRMINIQNMGTRREEG